MTDLTTTLTDAAFEAGRTRRAEWLGPNGDGSMGSLSAAFVRQDAERFAAGYEFAELTNGPTDDEQATAAAFMAGFRS